MLIVTTIYLQNVDSAAEPSATATLATKLTCADEIIVKKLTEAPDANRQLVTVYAGTNRVSPEGK